MAGCGTTRPASVEGLKKIVGDDLVGTIGATEKDQNNINRSVVRYCEVDLLTRSQCARHGELVAAAEQAK